MRSGTGEDKTVALTTQELCQFAAKAVIVGNSMTFVDDDDVPARLLQPGTELSIVLQCVDTDDGLIVEVEGILVHGYLRADAVHPDTVETDERNGKAIPYLFLELRQDALQRTDQNTAATAPANHLAEEDAHFDGLAQANTIGNEQARTGQVESLQRGLQLIVGEVEGSFLSDADLWGTIVVVADVRFDQQSGGTTERALVGHKNSIAGRHHGDIGVNSCIKNIMFITDEFAQANDIQNMRLVRILLNTNDAELLSTHRNTLTGCKILLIIHSSVLLPARRCSWFR